MYDINSTNIMYDSINDRLVFIDIDFWKKKGTVYETLLDNTSSIEDITSCFQLTK